MAEIQGLCQPHLIGGFAHLMGEENPPLLRLKMDLLE